MGCPKLSYYPTDFKVENYFKNCLTQNFSEKSTCSSYELVDHLGNVLVTLSDRKFPVKVGTTWDYYDPNVLSYSDYYPFGSLLPGRSTNSGDYRYGFNGMEMDIEVNNITGSSYTAEFWQYDSRLGRRWNVDPITYPWQSSYATFNNNPIVYSDPRGLEGTKDKNEKGKSDGKGTAYSNNDNTRTNGNTIQHYDKDCGCYLSQGLQEGGMASSSDASKTPTQSKTSGYTAKSLEVRNKILATGSNNPLARGILANESRGIYRGLYDSRKPYSGFSTGWEAGYFGLSDDAKFLMDATTYAVGGALGATVAVPILIQGGIISEASFQFGIIKTGVSATSQALFSGKVNIVGAFADGFMAPGVGDLTGAAFEINYSFQGGFQTRSILGTKKSDDVIREATIGTVFSFKGSGINYLSGEQSLFTKTILNSSNSLGNYGTQEGVRK